MKTSSERVLLGVVGGLLLCATASCSSSSSPPAGGGNATGSGGSGANQGGSSNVGGTNNGTGGAIVGSGGSSIVNGGAGGSAAGGLGGGGGAGGSDVTACSTDSNLVKASACWVGCDPASTTDNPMGLQGSFYTYGDGSSCTVMNPPCSANGICLSGSTVVDKTYAKWGCGMGLELNATGGTPSVKQAYTGSATCFNYTLTGSSGGNEVRIAFTQSADTTGKVSPYVSIPAFTNGKTGTVCLKDVSCQGQMNCTVGTSQYDLQVNVVGGNNAGAYNVCLTSLVPMGTGNSTLSQICGVQGASDASEDAGKYFAQNNVFPGAGNLCVTPSLNGAAAGLKIDSATFPAGGNQINAYPSIVDGWHYGRKSSDPALPKQVSSLASVNSAVTYTGSDGKYDAAYDIWVLPTATATTPAGGLEVMIWLNASSVNPAGNQAGSYNGWTVWTGTVNNWNYVAYVKTGQSSFTGDLAPFIKDAVSRTGTQTHSDSPYLAGIEFGFELYDPPNTGNNFAITSFTSDVK